MFEKLTGGFSGKSDEQDANDVIKNQLFYSPFTIYRYNCVPSENYLLIFHELII